MNVNMNVAWSPEAIEDLSSLRAYIAVLPRAGSCCTSYRTERRAITPRQSKHRSSRTRTGHARIFHSKDTLYLPYRFQHKTSILRIYTVHSVGPIDSDRPPPMEDAENIITLRK